MKPTVTLVLVLTFCTVHLGHADVTHDFVLQLLENVRNRYESRKGLQQTTRKTGLACVEDTWQARNCFKVDDSAYSFCLLKDRTRDIESYATTLRSSVGDIFCGVCCSVVEKERDRCKKVFCSDDLTC
ncbi:uncharacterized protein LOC133181416 [Saccostrea echinata]|uniref:uncharacterized protein LOC133181416 n=1 Tax=Saccostrea echinata TaxID=191078 RepID=UPI002A80308D|nr:uncharacterized protein LOC133181416 [Saccostrea echinata]